MATLTYEENYRERSGPVTRVGIVTLTPVVTDDDLDDLMEWVEDTYGADWQDYSGDSEGLQWEFSFEFGGER